MKAFILSIAIILMGSQGSLFANKVAPSTPQVNSPKTQPGSVFDRFIAHRQGNWVALVWSVGAPGDIDGFEVERSYDGTFFEVITAMPGGGAAVQKYQDHDVYGGYYYYRVKAYMSDGSVVYSPTKLVRLIRHG